MPLPPSYKRSVVSGFIYRIHRACSSWNLFHESLEKAKRILECNQHPPAFYVPIIKQALDTIIGASAGLSPDSQPSENQKSEKVPIMVQYRGKCTENYVRVLHKINAPCVVVMTLCKLKSVLPSLKPAVEKMIQVVYEIRCPCCTACYVGKTYALSFQGICITCRIHEKSSNTVQRHPHRERRGHSPANITRRRLSTYARGSIYPRAQTNHKH